MAAGMNPFALQLQQLQRRQAIADMLQQQGMQPQEQQTIGGPNPVVVRQSPFSAIAKLAQTFAGGKIQQSNDAAYQDIANQMMAAQRSSIGALGGGGQAPAPATPPANMPPDSIRAPGYQPPAVPPQPPAGGNQGSGNQSAFLENLQNAAMYGVDPEVLKAAAADQARTEQMKNDAATGIAPGERGNIVRRDSYRGAFVPGTGGIQDVNDSGQPFFRVLPGMAESQANVTGMNTAATQANTPHYESDPFHPGRTSVTYATPPALAGMPNAPMGSIGRGGQPAPAAPTAPPGGGNAADLEGQKVGAKTGQDYAASLNDQANSAVAGKRTLSEMGNLLQGFTPGAGTPLLSKLGAAVEAMGVDPATVQAVLGGNTGDQQAFQKGTAALAGEAAKQVTNRVTQTEFKVFLQNNPNWMMTPQGIKRVMDFMGKGFDQQIDQQQQFSKWSKTTSPDRWAIDFPAAYNQQQLARINAGKTNSAPASLTGIRTAKDTAAAAQSQGGPVQWKQGMTADQARAKYPKGTVFTFPDGSQGSL